MATHGLTRTRQPHRLNRLTWAALGLAVTVVVAASGCAASDDPPTECTVSNSVQRCWDVHVPEAVGGLAAAVGLAERVPLVIDLHGLSGDSDGQRKVSGFRGLADTEEFIVAWPAGGNESWNAGTTCCEPAASDATDDVAFLRGAIADLIAEHPVDPDRVYLTGWSNGCAMAQRLSVEASDLIAATACMALYLLVDAPPDYSPVPVMTFHGTSDGIIEFGPSVFPGALQNVATWSELNSCGEPVLTEPAPGSALLSYPDCADGTQVALMSITDGGHDVYPGTGTDIATTTMAWEFMSQFNRADRSTP